MLLLSLCSLLVVFARLVGAQPLAGGGYRRYGGNFNPYNCVPYPTYGGNYGNAGGSGYSGGGGYGGGAYGGGAKPSYGYTAPYQQPLSPASNYGYGYRPGSTYGVSQGYMGGLSGYEGPSGGYNTYVQPAISYPPPYGGAGYGAGSSNYGGGSLPPYGNGNPNGIIGQPFGGIAGDCIDRSADCAVQAASGMCAGNPSVQALCPRSCGICGSIINPVGGGINPVGGGIGGNFIPGGPGNIPPFGVGGIGTSSLAGIPSLPPTGLSPSAPFTGIPESTFLAPQLGQFPQCVDAHVQGCPVWAAYGYCERAPEFMLSYCRASCGMCGPTTGIFPDVSFPFTDGLTAPIAASFDDLSQLINTGMQPQFQSPHHYKSSIFSAPGFEKRGLNKVLFDSESADRPPSSLSTIVRMDQLAGSA